MSQIPVGPSTATLVLAALIVCGVTALAADSARVTVRLYDYTSRHPNTRAAAMETTTAILSHTGIDMQWRDCSAGSTPCNEVRRQGELILRIVPDQVGGRAELPASIETRRSVHDVGLALGFSVLEPRTRAGVVATVFLDRVQLVADRAGVEFNALLGRTIAHELGHLLLGTMGHSRDGLMREVWTDEELLLNRPEDFLFAPVETIGRMKALTASPGRDSCNRQAACAASAP